MTDDRLAMRDLVRRAREDLLNGRGERALSYVIGVLDMMLDVTETGGAHPQ